MAELFAYYCLVCCLGFVVVTMEDWYRFASFAPVVFGIVRVAVAVDFVAVAVVELFVKVVTVGLHELIVVSTKFLNI